jgi:hypothetical protein
MRCAVFMAVILGLLAGCTSSPVSRSDVEYRNYDLELVHPSPYATYIQVMPGSLGADMPRLRKLDNRAFNRFLRDRIGCVYDASREITPIGSARLPAGYMVPVQCTGPAS